MPDDGANAFAIVKSPALALLQAQRQAVAEPELLMLNVPFEFVMATCNSELLNSQLARHRVQRRAKPVAQVFLRGERFFASVTFEIPPDLIVPLDVWAWENKR